MTFEQMRAIAKERMERQIKFFSRNVITFDEVNATLSSYKSIGLFTDDEYLDFIYRIRYAKLKR